MPVLRNEMFKGHEKIATYKTAQHESLMKWCLYPLIIIENSFGINSDDLYHLLNSYF